MSISHSYIFKSQIFGEGSVLIKDKKTGEDVIFMMTYQNNIVYKLDSKLQKVI